MGVVANIGISLFPKQGKWIGLRTKVCFNYDTEKIIMGTIVRDDLEEPFVTIIKLDDGRYITANECQYSPEI